MKSSFLIILSFFLATAILAPSIMMVIGVDSNVTVAIDFGEEENSKEEKKEINEKDFLFNLDFNSLIVSNQNCETISHIYIERNYSSLRTIFLPPPEYQV